MKQLIAIEKRTYFPDGCGIDTMHYARYHGFERDGCVWQNIQTHEFATMPNLEFVVDEHHVSDFRNIFGAKVIEIVGCKFFSADLLVGDFSHWDILKDDGSDERIEDLLMASRISTSQRRYRVEMPRCSDSNGRRYEAAIGPTVYDPIAVIRLTDKTIETYPVIDGVPVYFIRNDFFPYLARCIHPAFFLTKECTQKD